MGKGFIAITALALAVAGVAGGAILEEDFSDATFPPDGWSVIIENHGMEIIEWERFNVGGNYCARGHVFGYYESTGSTTLATKSIPLTGAPTCVSFKYYSDSDGALTYLLRLQLWQGGMARWSQDLPHSENWAQVRVNFPTYMIGDYGVGWKLSGENGSPHGPRGNGYFYVDDVVVEENTGISPTSLGRVKALYR
ncbi:MAG: hypothetical protein PVH29_05150 [Candidatus Zixiibacteriota bacterium]|jgi:hypothetical protein